MMHQNTPDPEQEASLIPQTVLPEYHETYLKNHARAERLVGLIRELYAMRRTLRRGRFDLDFQHSEHFKEFFLDELAATGEPLLLEIHPQLPEESLGRKTRSKS